MRYTSNNVGENAGALWRFLDENGPASINQAKDALDFTRTDLMLSVGWLLREEKIMPEPGKGRAIKFKTID